MIPPVRTAVVDDQAIVRAGVARILGPADGFDVVAQCRDGADLLRRADELALDLVVMDVRMAGVDGIEATRRLQARPRRPPVLVLTTFDEDEVLWGAVEAGASGFVLKDAGAGEIIAAARAVAAGAAWFDPAVTPRVLAAYRRRVAPARRTSRNLELLTAREREVLAHVARGATNGEIAAELYLSEATAAHRGDLREAGPARPGGGHRLRLRPRRRRTVVSGCTRAPVMIAGLGSGAPDTALDVPVRRSPESFGCHRSGRARVRPARMPRSRPAATSAPPRWAGRRRRRRTARSGRSRPSSR